MDLTKRLKKIDEFFDSLSIDEFEKMAIAAGINEIKSHRDFDAELLLDFKTTSNKLDNTIYINHNFYNSSHKDNFDLYNKDLSEAI